MSARIIAGAGLAGLIAAHAFPRRAIFEAASGPRQVHKAVLRFRSDAVSRLTGIEFEPVRVRKGIWHQERFVAPNIALANSYSAKCLGEFHQDRSIWNLEPATRYIAPEDFYDQLVEAAASRINWGTPVDLKAFVGDAPISTIPLPFVLKQLGEVHPGVAFRHKEITVRRWRVPRCRLFQTVYFPDPDMSLYRASITGDLLVAEYVRPTEEELATTWELSAAFGIMVHDAEPLEMKHKQTFGKIAPIPDAMRKAIIGRLTEKYGIFSLGRFATWRNVLLDDVVDDISVLKRLMKSERYERRLAQL